MDFDKKRFLLITIACIIYGIGYYDRNCPGVLLKQMAESFNRTVPEMGQLSSTYFWSYAIVQPLIGSFSDLFDTSYIVSAALVLSSGGMLLCATSKSFYLTCASRLLVGLGCGCIYVPVCRAFAQWFSPAAFPYAQSFIIACGGLGGLLAQGPIGSFSLKYGWPPAFYIGSALSIVFSVIAYFVLEGTPEGKMKREKSPKQVFSDLFRNIVEISKHYEFWLLASWKFLTPSTYTSVSSTWGSSYMQMGFNYDQTKASHFISMTSFAWTVGAPLLALVTNLVKSRKLVIISCTFIASITAYLFYMIKSPPNETVLQIYLFVFALSSGSSLTVSAIYFKELLTKDLVGTLMGCGNMFMLLGTSIEQYITGEILKNSVLPNKKYPLSAYRTGLWLLSFISITISLIPLSVLKDTYQKSMNEPSQNEPLLDK